MIAQAAVTILSDILAGHETAVQTLLENAGRDAADNSLVPFSRLPSVHFARFFVLPSTHDLHGRPLAPRLVFLADVDGSEAAFLRALVDLAASGLDALYRHCAAYTGPDNLERYLYSHRTPATASYVNTIGRGVLQIQQEAALHDALSEFVDRNMAEFRDADPRQVRASIQDYVDREPALGWARQSVPPPPTRYVVGERLHLLLTAIAGIVLLPVVLVGLPPWLYVLRRHERSDNPHDVWPDDRRVEILAAQEEHGVQNPFTSAGYLKPGPFRRFTATLVLWGTHFLARHVFNHASLIGVKTIHFARWIFIDDKRRVIFASNYDGSLENYMDDFIDKIAWGLNATFSNGVDYPRTNWLVLDGAHDEQVFKRFNLTHQTVAPFWYTAYQGLTALNIDNNSRLRAGLYGPLDAAAARAWLRRI